MDKRQKLAVIRYNITLVLKANSLSLLYCV